MEKGIKMIDPPRSWNADGFHNDKFHWTVDIEKYPNEKFIIWGIVLGRDLKILFVPHWDSELGVFNNNILERVDKFDKEWINNLPFTFFESVKSLTWGSKKMAWRGALYWKEFETLEELGYKVHKFTKPVIIKGLQNIKIKGVLK